MKKQFNRMRQLANQTVGRAEKTEVLSEDLLQVEKRLELVKQVSHSTHKKLTACLQGQQGVDADKRSKKLPLTTLAQCLMEGSAILGDDSLLGKMLKLCGEVEDKLAQELIHFELEVERDVIDPLFVLAEVEIPNIQKQRKHLAKLVLDMDSSRTRWQQSAKSSGLSSNLQPSGAKADALREEMEEAANRVEICRDQLSADMYNFVAKEIDYANYFQTLIEVQAEYHRKSLALLQNVLPQIKAQQEAWIEKPSFGKPLEEHLAVSGREIAFPIEACVTMLLECGMQEEGLFRVAPSASKLKKLKAALDCCVVDVQEYSADPHAIAGALKSYLRELPEPLMTFELYDEWIQASNIQDQDKRLQALWNACEKLPKANYNNIRYLIKFLAKLTEYQDANKMTPSNVAIVLGPNLLWPQAEGNITEMMTTVSLQIVGIIEPLIQHADWFFPGDIEFNVTGNYGSPMHVNHNANYSSMPSPDMDHSDRKQHDQARRPLSVATDNMMLEFYKKDGMGVRVMDTSWVARRGTTIVRKASSTPPAMQPPAPPSDLAATPQSPIPEQSLDISATPSPTPTSFGFQPGAERASTDDVSSSWLDSCYHYPSPEDDRPPPYPCYQHLRHYHPQARPEAPSPPYRWSGHSQTLPPRSSSSSSSPSPQPLDINSNPKPCFLHLPKQSSLTESHALETNLSAPSIKPPLVLAKPDPPGAPYPSLMSASPPWVGCASDRGAGLTSTLKTKELSPMSGQKGSPSSGHVAPCGSMQQVASPTQQLSTEQSPHALRKVSKKLAPITPKVPYGQSGGMSDQSTGQPSPVSLSPTPPSTPSPYGLNYPHGYSLASGQLSPAAAPSLSSPPSLTSTLTKSRPTPKPRQRPTLPPPQPPTASLTGASPQSMDHTLLDDMSPGESMSTDLVHFDVPSIHVEVDPALHRDPLEQTQRHSVAGKVDSEEEDSESTAL
ncbi:rho GTPase-activating protein 44 isoform X4 [Malaclemys terrapin pileata]|uniref:rho GTPase-activating protein 44 isoform X4 n=1 Tax=Malaclemys terrapin pileata TaxID=2991368 RepID=UPI0023A7D5AC|nr:rho GTPase-activating protein 44 isoform X4 [Malaclemys terrapin pileata]